MINTLIQFFISAVLVFYSARLLAQSSDTIAKSTRLGHFFVGSFLLAASTSLPEFFVDIRATLANAPDLAAGDLLGSSMVNLSIFAIVVLTYHKKLPSRIPKMTKPVLTAILLTFIVVFSIQFSDYHYLFFGISTGSLTIIGMYILGIRFFIEKDQTDPHLKISSGASQSKNLFPAIIRFLSATALLFFSSPWIISSISKLSELSGIDHSFMGATLLALTTSLPELVASMVAARMGLFDLVLGNIIGSNSFNMIIFFFMDWIWKNGALWEHLSKKHIVTGVTVILNMTLLMIFGLSEKNKGKKQVIGAAMIIFFSNIISYGALFFFR